MVKLNKLSLKVSLILFVESQNQPIHERDSVTIDLFGRWQTEKYKPPPAKDVSSIELPAEFLIQLRSDHMANADLCLL